MSSLDWARYFEIGDIFSLDAGLDKSVLYHGTAFNNLERIMEEGLKPSSDPIEMTTEIVELYRQSGADKMSREISDKYGTTGSFINLASWKGANYGKDGGTSIYFSETPGRALTYADKIFTGGEMRTCARGCLDLLEKLGKSDYYDVHRKALINRYWNSVKKRIPELLEILERESFDTNIDEIDFTLYSSLRKIILDSSEINVEAQNLGLYDEPITRKQLLDRVAILREKYSQIYDGMEDSKHGLLLAVQFDDSDIQYFRNDLGGMNHGLAFSKKIHPGQIVGFRKVLETSWDANYLQWEKMKNLEQFTRMSREKDSDDIVAKIHSIERSDFFGKD